MKKLINKLGIRRLRIAIELFLDYLYDMRRYARFSINNKIPKTNEQLKFRLLQRAHSFEKAFSLPEVRPGFGKTKMLELEELIMEYRKRGMDTKNQAFQMAMTAVKTYSAFNDSSNSKNSATVISATDICCDATDMTSITRSRRDITLKKCKGDFQELSSSRCSIRQFAETPVDEELIRNSVLIAQKSPSVCNRQSGHVIRVTDRKARDSILKLQNGNKGFSEQIKELLIVTASLESFSDPRERNQAYIDGGLFAMSLLYALHFNQLATCPLNWSANRKKDRKIRNLIKIPDSHVIIMLIAVGNFKDNFVYATSPRRDFCEVYLER